ncbi:MAG: quercetin 2,3-dioxygenase [Actinomycetota bacterium]|nr:quercetin 2,3-dioxygenase [Actinomycetota bacterium]
MSNLERDPHETVAGGLATVSPEPTRRLLEPREVPLGGTRAMVVRRTLPHRDLPTVGAWCFVDDYGPADVSRSSGMHVPPHPHTGLQTVTWLLAGEVHHQDSVGSQQRVRPGELSIMTAGRGIAHAETSPPDHPPLLRGVQLWVALPDGDRHVRPHFAHHATLPVVVDGGLRATVMVGSVAGERSPAESYTPLVGADLVLDRDATARLPVEADFEHAVLALGGDVTVDGAPVPAASLVYLGCGRREIALAAGSSGARLLLLGGAPFEEELLMWWNFIGRDHEEIVAFRTEWEASRAGAATRFDPVTGYDGPPLPAPELPTTRLRPRRRR